MTHQRQWGKSDAKSGTWHGITTQTCSFTIWHITCDDFPKHPEPSHTSEGLNVNHTIGDQSKELALNMTTSQVVLCKTGDFYALPCRI